MTDIIKKSYPQKPTHYDRRETDTNGYELLDTPLIARGFIEKLFKRKYLILAIMLAALIPTAIYIYLATPLYRSFALIQIDPDPIQVLPYREIGDLSATTPNYEIYMKTQEQIIKSPTITSRISQRLKSESNSDAIHLEIPQLSSRFEIRRIEGSQLFEVAYLAPIPEVAADMVNIFAEEYMKEHFRSRQQTREKAQKLLEGELRELEQRVQASEKELVQYATDHNMISAGPEASLIEQKLPILAEQLIDSEATLIVARGKMESLKKASIDNFPKNLLTPNLVSLNANILELEHQLTALRSTYGENWPSVIQKRNEIALVRDQLLREKASALAQAREEAQAEIRVAETHQRMISDTIDNQQQLVTQYRNASIQYNILGREVETSQKLYEGLLERLKQTSVTAGLEFGNIHMVQAGFPNTKADSPKAAAALGLSSFLGLALGICFALMKDFWDDSLSTLGEVERVTSIPALGSVPYIKTLKTVLSISSGNKKSNGRDRHKGLLAASTAPTVHNLELPPEGVEAIRILLASILLSNSDRPPQTIMITSAMPSEGKTTMANLLGRALADCGKSTLLVESDMRRPFLSKNLGIDGSGGLSLFLSGHISPLPKIQKTNHAGLFAVAAGPKAPNPLNLLNSKRMEDFINEMTHSYQFVLLDAPPLLAVADARVLCSKVDGVVLVVRAEHTPKHLIHRARTLLESSGANILGLVLNQTSKSNFESAYYRHYYN